jgi:hypothetical protein
MNGNGTHPNKPRSVLCRRAALIRWTGWTDDQIGYLVGEKKLRSVKYNNKAKRAWRYFYVESAQELLDSGW